MAIAVCPRGHDSAEGNYCDVCGSRLTPAPSPSWSWFESSATSPRPAPGPARASRIPTEPQRFEAPVIPPSPARAPTMPAPAFTRTAWNVLIASDRAYYDWMQAVGGASTASVSFPAGAVGRRITLSGSQMRIGRRSANRDFEPEIDLAEPPADRGVSRLHAALVPGPDGTWSLLDYGSANGTLRNGRRVPTGAMVPLREGDRINLGAWTLITVHRG